MMTKDDVLLFLRQFREANQTKYNIAKIGVFGSVARDEMSDSSDIDIVVDLATPDYLSLAEIKQLLEEQFHRSVDIVRYRKKMNTFLKQRIDREAIYV